MWAKDETEPLAVHQRTLTQETADDTTAQQAFCTMCADGNVRHWDHSIENFMLSIWLLSFFFFFTEILPKVFLWRI